MSKADYGRPVTTHMQANVCIRTREGKDNQPYYTASVTTLEKAEASARASQRQVNFTGFVRVKDIALIEKLKQVIAVNKRCWF